MAVIEEQPRQQVVVWWIVWVHEARDKAKQRRKELRIFSGYGEQKFKSNQAQAASGVSTKRSLISIPHLCAMHIKNEFFRQHRGKIVIKRGSAFILWLWSLMSCRSLAHSRLRRTVGRKRRPSMLSNGTRLVPVQKGHHFLYKFEVVQTMPSKSWTADGQTKRRLRKEAQVTMEVESLARPFSTVDRCSLRISTTTKYEENCCEWNKDSPWSQ
jgi:hypothetical protein